MGIKAILIVFLFFIFFFSYLVFSVYHESKKFEERIKVIEEQNTLLEEGDNMIKNFLSRKKPYDPYYKGFTSNDDVGKTAGDFRLERDIAIAKLGDKEIELSALQKRFDTLYENYIAICNKTFEKAENKGDNNE